MDVKTERVKAVTTLIVDFALIYNIVAAAKGWTAIPVDYENVYLAVSAAATIAGCVWTWWFNQSLTDEAVAGTILTRNLKSARNSDNQVE